MLMEVPVRDGELEFHYVRRGIDWLGLGLTFITLLGLAATTGTRSSQFGQWVSMSKMRRARVRTREALGSRTIWIVGGAVVAMLGAAAWHTAKPPLIAGSRFRSGSAITANLGGTPCRSDVFASWQCGANRIEPGIRGGLYGAHFCMSAPTSGPLVLTIANRGASFVSGVYDTADGSGHIKVEIADRLVGQMNTRDKSQGLQFFKFDARAYVGETGPVKVTMTGAPLHCFDLSVEP